MPKRKATKAELEYGIGEVEIDDEGIEPEEADDTQIIGLEADEENKIDDEKLVEAYKKESVKDKGGEQ